MEHPLVVVEHDVDLPRVIVWDAFVDQDLVSGWLAEAEIVPEVGGEYNLTWTQHPGKPQSWGRVAALQYPELLIVDSLDLGLLEFTLTELPGGIRGTATRVRVEVGLAGDTLDAERVGELWRTNFEQLEELLRGHPTDFTAKSRG